jgi:hypothetical protein
MPPPARFNSRAAITGAILLSPRLLDKIVALMGLPKIFPAVLLLIWAGSIAPAQTPTPSPAPSATPDAKQLINSLSPSEIDEAVRLLKANFINPNALKDQEISRATLEGLIARLHGGVTILPPKNSASTETPVPFYSDVLENHIGYLRLGSLTADNLRELDRKLADFSKQKIDAIVIDLRASGGPGDFEFAAEHARRFIGKGKNLWTLHKPASRQDRTFTNERDPAFTGTIMVLIDGETNGVAEAVAATLKTNAQALLIGEPTAGRAVEYANFPLGGGKSLSVAVGELIAPKGGSLFPGGVKPDLDVPFPPARKKQIFALSLQRGVAPFVYENERPHFNEAALIAGTNPELEAKQGKRNTDERLYDPVLQRAVDVITSLTIFGKR